MTYIQHTNTKLISDSGSFLPCSILFYFFLAVFIFIFISISIFIFIFIFILIFCWDVDPFSCCLSTSISQRVSRTETYIREEYANPTGLLMLGRLDISQT